MKYRSIGKFKRSSILNQRSKDVTQVQQQRPELPTVTLTWHACKYKVHKFYHKYILKCALQSKYFQNHIEPNKTKKKLNRSQGLNNCQQLEVFSFEAINLELHHFWGTRGIFLSFPFSPVGTPTEWNQLSTHVRDLLLSNTKHITRP